MFKYLVKIAIIFSVIFCLLFSFSNFALALGGIQPPLNELAPEFILPTNKGDGEISLKDYRGKWVVLYFYPQDFTPGCTLEAKRFQQDLAKYQALNTEIIGVSVDDVHSHEDFGEEEGLNFPLLADTEGKVSKDYGSWLSGRSMRHTYIINPDGVLVAQFLGVHPAIHSQEILRALTELQKSENGLS
ncbi:alkyl hydroperoxide reductase subunit C-like protein [Geminocystis sp. NIES-3708]|uniref:peroxiredoxin n=1 Tax=Geminocystis sp. NIES-3708 TaxID=1615909 RepID=UPI0005FC3957|nr:peroxiredoxin [Geminocystis sp. NIES-3708]BAQ62888.1 alkyl hydroperoxide reductase subunit C-like protein [Geminocystis sp. NIES-3708]